MRSIAFFAFVLLSHVLANAQTITVTPFDAQVAKSVKIEQLNDGVAVILNEKIANRTGAYLQVQSPKKWATPVYDGIEITQTKNPGEWIMFAPPAKYRVLLIEFDTETGPRYSYHDVVTGTGQPPVDTNPPATGDFATLAKVAKEAADKLNDPPTRAALASAYASALSTIAGKSYAEAQTTVQLARRATLNARQGASRDVDWQNSWLKVVDAELTKVVPPGDVAKYAAAIEAIIKGLRP